MTTIDQIFKLEDLEARIDAGYVSRRTHPEFPNLVIVNYTDRCQFDGAWDEVTTRARGVIYDAETREVLALPIKKLFNYGQGDAQYNLDAPIVGAFDKLDGSLGVGYRAPDGSYRIATRGSFDSEQARHANAWLAANPQSKAATLLADAIGAVTTPLFEIIYPDNRIVIDYQGRDEVVFLGHVDRMPQWAGKFYPELELASDEDPRTLRETLTLAPRDNAEGWVVWLDRTTAVKIKYEKYVELHRAISNMTPKEAWRQLRAGTFDEFAEALPDEFHDWVKGIERELMDEFEAAWSEASGRTHELRLFHNQVIGGRPRRELAEWVKREVRPEIRGLVFGMLDHKDISDSIWRMLEPRAAAA